MISSSMTHDTYMLLHSKPWIPGDEKSIFTVVIPNRRSPLRQFARVRIIDEYDIIMPVPRVRVTSQINCGDVTKSEKNFLGINGEMSDRWMF